MTSIHLSAPAAGAESRCYRLTARGRACVQVVESSDQTIGSLSRYLHDVLLMCGSGVWFDQLREFMPPRSLEESLHALLSLGLIELLEPQEAPCRAQAVQRARAFSAFGQVACAA